MQGLLLREHGYDCDEGVLYFVDSRERVLVAFDDELLAATSEAVEGLRRVAAEGIIPPPLEDSPKCPRCSLVEVCLPDEVNHLIRADVSPRPIAVPCTDALPLYVQARRAKVAKSGETLVVTVDDAKLATARLEETSQVVVMGNVSLTTPCLHELMWRGIPVTWHSYGGWFFDHTTGNGHKNVELRTAQYRASFDESTCLGVARGLVSAKIQNCRTLLRRNWKRTDSSQPVLIDLKRPRFSWTRIKGESNVQGGGGNGSVEGRGTGRGIGADGGSPEGDWSPCRRGGGRGGLPGAGAAVERQPEARRGAAATAWRIARGAVP